MARKVRVGGGFTVFHWSIDGGTEEKQEVIAFADTVTVNSVTPVAAAQAIQPLNALRPIEIVTPRAHTNGTIVLTLTELYNEAIWQRLAGLAGSRDIIDIMEYLAGVDNGARITKYVRTPGGSNTGDYYETFHNCVITRVSDDETIRIDTMSINKEIEVWYTHSEKRRYSNMNQSPRAALFT
jgi:hypothetical protein